MERKINTNKIVIKDGDDNILFETRPKDGIVILKFQDDVTASRVEQFTKRMAALRQENDWTGGIIIMNKCADILSMDCVKFSKFLKYFFRKKLERKIHFKMKLSFVNFDLLNKLRKVAK